MNSPVTPGLPSTASSTVFADAASAVAGWDRGPVMIRHHLGDHPLFTLDALGTLIEGYPRAEYAIVRVNEDDGTRCWREGEIVGLSGREVIESIRRGRMWLNLRNLNQLDARYAAVVRQMFAELEAAVPGLATHKQDVGIIISSPGGQVGYHCDLPGQGLFQIQGKKRIFLYPGREPYLKPTDLENIALRGVEVSMQYEPRYDTEAVTFDLVGSQSLFWPLNWPHRIDNGDVLNISMTVEYWTGDIRRRHMVNLGNGILRQMMGYTPKGRATSGPSFYAKAGLQAVMRRTGMLKPIRAAARPIEFKLDRAAYERFMQSVPAPAAMPGAA
jgi:hypothetical protein